MLVWCGPSYYTLAAGVLQCWFGVGHHTIHYLQEYFNAGLVWAMTLFTTCRSTSMLGWCGPSHYSLPAGVLQCWFGVGHHAIHHLQEYFNAGLVWAMTLFTTCRSTSMLGWCGPSHYSLPAGVLQCWFDVGHHAIHHLQEYFNAGLVVSPIRVLTRRSGKHTL